MTWRWKAFSIRFTPTSPSRTSSELRRDAMARPRSTLDHVRAGDPVVQTALLAVEADPEEPEHRRREPHEVARGPCGAPRDRRSLAPDVDDPHAQQAHAERLAQEQL